MSVKVTSFSGPVWDYVHDDYPPSDNDPDNPSMIGHSGLLDASSIVYAINMDGEPNTYVIVVPCPEDGAISYWPSGGGADARLGQMLHLRLALKDLPRADALNQLKAKIAATDGPERFLLTEDDIDEVVNASAQ